MKKSYWVCQAAGWGFYSGVGLAAARYAAGVRTWQLYAGYALFFAYSILFTHQLRGAIQQRHWLQQPFRRALPRLLGASLLCGALQSSAVLLFDWILHGGDLQIRELASIGSLYAGVSAATCAWTTLYVAISALRRYQAARVESLQLQLALKQAEMRVLEAQVNPHFLFNSLNTIRGLIVENPERARDLVTRLAALLRHNLERQGSGTASLSAELEVVKAYLSIEAARFEERLQTRYEIEPDCAEVAVPRMILQILAENAIKHGIAQRPEGGRLILRARREAGRVVIEMENSGRLGAGVNGTGLGLNNARERLWLLYGDRAGLELLGLDDERVLARMWTPLP